MIADLNGSGNYLTWGFVQISIANLIVVGAMLVLFVLALVLPFPRGKRAAENTGARSSSFGDDNPADVGWTGKIRIWGLRHLPPGKLLPDTQPAYVSSWAYVFGVASLSGLAVVALSGVILAFGGSDWWHTSSVGHFMNSLHLWSVELFMAFLVIHLWIKFWMAAWRGNRAKTWITGVFCFLVAIVAAFTGYLSQQNFDSQWIATNGKDAFNAVGVGSVFNVLNFGQMFMWHIVLMPLVLVVMVVVHVLLVRAKGVVQPIATIHGAVNQGSWRDRVKAGNAADAAEWKGPTRRYDIVKEGSIAMVVILAATVVLGAVFSSPDEAAITIQTWSQASPLDFVTTASSELAATSGTAQYGPPYSDGTDSVQSVGINWQTTMGVRIPVDTAQAFVLGPLQKVAALDPKLTDSLTKYTSASPDQQATWNANYATALAATDPAPVVTGTSVTLASGDYGPVPVLMSEELALAESGGLDGMLTSKGFYGTDYTQPLLFLADGTYYSDQATNQNLTGDQWGVNNETGNYPGQPWLWMYQAWYHVGPWHDSSNIDVWAVYLTGLATLLLVLVPFIPGLRSLPRWIPVHRLIWRKKYLDAAGTPTSSTINGDT